MAVLPTRQAAVRPAVHGQPARSGKTHQPLHRKRAPEPRGPQTRLGPGARPGTAHKQTLRPPPRPDPADRPGRSIQVAESPRQRPGGDSAAREPGLAGTRRQADRPRRRPGIPVLGLAATPRPGRVKPALPACGRVRTHRMQAVDLVVSRREVVPVSATAVRTWARPPGLSISPDRSQAIAPAGRPRGTRLTEETQGHSARRTRSKGAAVIAARHSNREAAHVYRRPIPQSEARPQRVTRVRAHVAPSHPERDHAPPACGKAAATLPEDLLARHPARPDREAAAVQPAPAGLLPSEALDPRPGARGPAADSADPQGAPQPRVPEAASAAADADRSVAVGR